ncbi:MAG: hypothetical protein K0Q87_3948 [Neobacillus sp.]|nr:hypothetical protein [Neobacillus sp.]
MNILYAQNEQKGPLIGILTARNRHGEIAGNGALFIEIQKKLLTQNAVSFIFTQDGVNEDTINGYMFLPEKNAWKRITVPFPNLVYNRIPFRKSEQDANSQLFFSQLKEKNIPFFNPCFIDKYELYCLLKDHPILKKHIPITILANHKKRLSAFLITHGSIYLKPSQSARGKGIFRLSLEDNEKLQLTSINQCKSYRSFDSFWLDWKKELIDRKYLAQEEIHPDLYNGKRFDFRILAHAEKDGFIVTGVGIRQSQDQQITTHIPTGGKLLPYQLLQTEKHDRFIEMAVKLTGKSLSDQFGYFGEFSIDAGISQSGKYYIYEVNSKPMSFDENEIEERKISQLCHLFFQLTKY